MRDEIKSYIAGIIDGEGSIMLISNHKNQLPSPCISISSSTLELLEWIKSATNVGTIIKKKNYNPEYHRKLILRKLPCKTITSVSLYEQENIYSLP